MYMDLFTRRRIERNKRQAFILVSRLEVIPLDHWTQSIQALYHHNLYLNIIVEYCGIEC